MKCSGADRIFFVLGKKDYSKEILWYGGTAALVLAELASNPGAEGSLPFIFYH